MIAAQLPEERCPRAGSWCTVVLVNQTAERQRPQGAGKGAQATALAQIQQQLERGDVLGARAALGALLGGAEAGPQEKEEARLLLGRLGVDPRAMLAAGAVLAVIAAAGAAALLHYR